MRELTFVEPGRLEWREAEDPMLEGDGQAHGRSEGSAEKGGETVHGRAHGPQKGGS